MEDRNNYESYMVGGHSVGQGYALGKAGVNNAVNGVVSVAFLMYSGNLSMIASRFEQVSKNYGGSSGNGGPGLVIIINSTRSSLNGISVESSHVEFYHLNGGLFDRLEYSK